MKQPNIPKQVDDNITLKNYNSSVVAMSNDFRKLTRKMFNLENLIKTNSAYLMLLTNSIIREYA